MYKALIIDDEKPVHTVITALGKWAAFGIDKPSTAVNGADGLACMRELRPDIVFVDMRMPVIGGPEFLNRARKEFPNTKFIVVSGYDDFNYAKVALQNGALDYLLKPVVERELDSALERVVKELNNERDMEFAEPLPDIPPLDQIPDIIKDYLDENYAREISLNMFSQKYFFTKEYISKLFKKKFNCGIYEYLLSIRMQRAKELLRDDEIKIQDIAERLGYSNNNYFSKAFKNYYGISPSEYRENSN